MSKRSDIYRRLKKATLEMSNAIEDAANHLPLTDHEWIREKYHKFTERLVKEQDAKAIGKRAMISALSILEEPEKSTEDDLPF